MAKKRQYNTIRTDTLEGMIAHYNALGNHEAARALLWLAQEIAAPIDRERIAQEATKRREAYQMKR